ncbi:MAG: peptide chain release factor N(5)-glutamine methyltransferase [Erysipelotrichaceae bacterium]
MASYNDLLFHYQQEIEDMDIPFQTVKLFLFELCNEEEIDIYLNQTKDLPESIVNKFHDGMKRIMKHEPMNYVLGYAWFFGYRLKVNQDVLVPRYETEELVANVLNYVDEYFGDYTRIQACDIGTGSGAIAIALKKEEDRFSMIASDISIEAVEVAKENARLNQADIQFTDGNMLDPIIAMNHKVDILLCNPPYIPIEEVLEVSVKDFEPNIALFGGEDGLKYYKEVFENGAKILNAKSLLAFEIGYNQKDVLEALAKKSFPNAKIETLKDINGKDRMLFVMNQ